MGFDVERIWGGLLKKNGREMAKSAIFWVEPASGTSTKSWYLYPLCRGEVVPVPLKVVPVPIDRRGLVPVLVQVVSVLMLPTTLIFAYFVTP